MRPGRSGRRSLGGDWSGIGLCLSLAALACLLGDIVGPQPATAGPDGTDRDASGLLAPAGTCADEGNEDAPAFAQEQAMFCLIDFARQSAGLPSLTASSELARSANAKADDILRCDSFSHVACHREFTFWMRRVGFLSAPCWRAGENLAWGLRAAGSARRVMRALIRSPEHRDNMLGGYALVGIGLQTGRLNGHAGAHVWVQSLGSHCQANRPRH